MRSPRPLLGLSLHADLEFLARTRRVAEELAECFEITPETLWSPDGSVSPMQRLLLAIRERSGKPFLGHGVGLSLGAARTVPRHEDWLARIARDHAMFDFAWYSEHLGFTDHDDLLAVLPLPLPPTAEAILAVAARLERLSAIVPQVLFENNVSYFAAAELASEPAFFAAICARSGASMLLDLHNAHTQCVNAAFPLDVWLDALDLTRVVEIHLSGGSESDPEWLGSRRVYRLDTHDGPVPEPVWRAFERVLPRCPNLRAVVIERMPAGLDDAGVPQLEQEFARARDLLP